MNPNANYFELGQGGNPINGGATKPVTVLSSNAGKSIVDSNTASLQKMESSYLGPSVVDFLGSAGKASDFASRQKLAQEQGITGYTGSAGQNTALLKALRTTSTSPVSSAMTNTINQVNGQNEVGQTDAERAKLKEAQDAEDTAMASVAKAKAALESKDYKSMDYWTAKASADRTAAEDKQTEYFNSIKDLRQELTANMTPSQKAQDLSNKVINIKNQAAQFKLQTQQDKMAEYQGQTLGFAGGRAAELDYKASFKNQEFALDQANLLGELGLEQELQNMKGESIEQQLTFLADDYELQTKVQDTLSAREDALFDKANILEDNAKSTLTTLLTELQGVNPKSMDATSISSLETMAARAGIPFSLIKEALTTQYQKQVFDNSMKLRQEKRLENKDTSDKSSSRTMQVLDGFIDGSQLTPTEKSKVLDDLYSKGFDSDTPPAWFKEYIQNEKRQSLSLTVLKEEWLTYRDSTMANVKKKASSDDELD